MYEDLTDLNSIWQTLRGFGLRLGMRLGLGLGLALVLGGKHMLSFQ